MMRVKHIVPPGFFPFRTGKNYPKPANLHISYLLLDEKTSLASVGSGAGVGRL
jgi:hypothetical protein